MASTFPLWLRIAYTAFVAVLVPAYALEYGAQNFLWFSDVALLLGLVAVWSRSALLASTQALAALVPEMLWILEFALRAGTGRRIAGATEYMFDPSIPLFVRALSLFHVWLPAVLVWMVWRLGYDRRALRVQIVIGTVLLVATYALTPAESNVNWVHQWGSIAGLWPLIFSIVGFPLLFYVPAHLLLRSMTPST